MNFRILKKDLLRKKSMNFILLVFILLATMFIAASLKTLDVTYNGLDYYFEQAKLSDYILCVIGGKEGEDTENDKKIMDFLESQENVKNYKTDYMLLMSPSQFKSDKAKKDLFSDSAFVSSLSIYQQIFFDSENKQITGIKDGEIYVPKKIMEKNNLKQGDSVYIDCENGYRKEFSIKGYVKDAFLGSEMMGTSRFIVSENDYFELEESGSLVDTRMYSVFCSDLDKFEKDYNNCDFNVLFNCDKQLIKTTYIMDIIIALVLLMVSLCLIIIAVIMLRFTIIFTVNEDFKEIGIMKAIGVSNISIRKLYMAKYFILSILGAIAGFFASIPFENKLLDNVTENIVAESNSVNGFFLEMLISVIVIFIVTAFAYISTGKIKKMMPMDAIRRGNNGERFKKKNIFGLSGCKLRATTFMAVNDVLSELRKYIVLLITSAVGVWLVVMPINTINTLQSDEIAKWFALVKCDFWVIDNARYVELQFQDEKEKYVEYMDEVKERLEHGGLGVDNISMEIMFRLRARKGEYSYSSLAFQGLGTDTRDYFYNEGKAPILDNEVAVTHIVADKLKAGIGDEIYITIAGEERKFIITAIYQSMNNMGDGIRFSDETALDYSSVSGGFGMQVVVDEQSKEKYKDGVLDKAKEILTEAKIQSMGEFIDNMLGSISGKLQSLKFLILTVVLLINILVVVLMQKMFIIRERGEMGMLKAIGFSNNAIISWQSKRVMLVLFFGILLGTITGTPFSQITSGQVFKLMGASHITFQINNIEIYLIYPVIIFVVTVVACVITMLKVKRVSPQEINEAE